MEAPRFRKSNICILLILAALWCTARNTLIFTRDGRFAEEEKDVDDETNKFQRYLHRWMDCVDNWVLIMISAKKGAPKRLHYRV